MFKHAALLTVILLLGGCEATRAIVNEKAEDVGDAGVAVTVRTLCAQPYSALVRNQDKHPGLKDGVHALCGEL